jgi:hypothetical protein
MRIVQTYGAPSAYEINVNEADHVIITDLCGDGTNYKSVTNAAEAVVKDLIEHFGPNKRFFYYDTIGQLDELQHDGVKFVGFKAGCPF